VAVGTDPFVWGAENPGGVALGLAVDRATAARCEYRVALVNRSTEPRAIVVFATLDNTFRTRIIARQGAVEVARPAIEPAVPVTTNVRMVVEIPAGEMIVRSGSPASFGLTGAVALHVVLGGELASGEVSVSLDR